METQLKFPKLYDIDEREAIGNMETALDSVLNSFHNVIDSLNKQHENNSTNFYSIPELSTLLIFRNARHHNQGKGIRTIHDYLSLEYSIEQQPQILLVDYKPGEEDGILFKFFISLNDIEEVLSLPSKKTSIKAESKELVQNYLALNKLKNYRNEYGINDIFINFIPLVINAGIKIAPFVKRYREKELSAESYLFQKIFDYVAPSELDKHIVEKA